MDPANGTHPGESAIALRREVAAEPVRGSLTAAADGRWLEERGRAQRLYGLVYPRDTLFVKLVIFVMNLVLRIGRKPVRAAIRPVDGIERIVRESGLSPHFSQNVGPAWHVAIYRR